MNRRNFFKNGSLFALGTTLLNPFESPANELDLSNFHKNKKAKNINNKTIVQPPLDDSVDTLGTNMMSDFNVTFLTKFAIVMPISSADLVGM